jgi:peptidoglycan/LPS O-acetylase OafA/YrhL
LYAWPVQQVISNYFSLTAYQSLFVSVPIVAILGILSYIIIERPSLNLAGKVAFRLKPKKEIKKVPGLENFEYS